MPPHVVLDSSMPRMLAALALTISTCLLATPDARGVDAPSTKPRLLVLTDIGGDPDDQQAMVRLMLYTCDFDIEGLIASASGTPGELKEAVTRSDLIRQTVKAYGKVRPNLLLHHGDYSPAETLLERIKSGNPHRGLESIGDGHDTEGSKWIIEQADRDDLRPLNISIWGGQTDLAQALWRVRKDRSAEQLKAFLSKLRVYDIDDQDKIQPWIFKNFPDLFYILAKAKPGMDKRLGAYRGMYLGGDESLTSRDWIDAHIRTDHGPLGALYPTKTYTAPNPNGCMKEGDSPSWLYFLPTGLSDPAHPDWGSWGGRFLPVKEGSLFTDATDTFENSTDPRVTVWRWRPAFQADFQARMDWCVKPFAEANHSPVVVLNGQAGIGTVELSAAPGETVKLSAEGSTDPDGQPITFRWFAYREAGDYRGQVQLPTDPTPAIELMLPPDAAGSLHVILSATDQGLPPLTRYRRAVIRVGAKG
jgi:hypothetical protein